MIHVATDKLICLQGYYISGQSHLLHRQDVAVISLNAFLLCEVEGVDEEMVFWFNKVDKQGTLEKYTVLSTESMQIKHNKTFFASVVSQLPSVSL